MLDIALINQLKTIFAELNSEYSFVVEIAKDHSERANLVGMLEDVVSCSSKLSMTVSEGDALKFGISKDSVLTGIKFRAVPNGHEFTSLLLAILNLDGKGKNLPDESIANRIKALKAPVELTTYVSLTCTNCPDVVQTLNSMVALHPNISHTMVDGAIYEEEATEKHIQAVPSVFLNGELLHVGRGELVELLSKIEAKVGAEKVEVSTEDQAFDLLVVGGGPAGVAAAVYSARKGLNVGIIADNIGGQVRETVGIENFISTSKTTGKQLAIDLKEHISNYPIKVLENRKVENMVVDGSLKRLTADSGENFVAEAVIIASGASWRQLNVAGEKEYIGRGVAFCPHCDGPFYKGKHVAVIGGGNSGIEAAIDLAGIASKVTVVEFMENLKADIVLQNKLNSLDNVEVILNTQVKEVVGDGAKVNGLSVMDRADSSERIIALDGIFVQIGLLPNSKPFVDVVETTKMGEIVIDSHCRTSEKGIYSAGDVSSVPYKQIIIAMGEGAKAALTAFDDRIRGEL